MKPANGDAWRSARARCPGSVGVSFTWEGAWEYDQMSGSGRVALGKDGRLKASIRIKDGDSSTFVVVRVARRRAGKGQCPIRESGIRKRGKVVLHGR
jgi:hypothetical protein